MPRQLTEDDARQSLANHAADKGRQAYAKYGPDLGWRELHELLDDRTLVRYPCQISFDAAPLQEGEFAATLAKTDNPEDGYTIFIHPIFSLDPNQAARLVLYHLVVVNYGDMATAAEAENFGAAALGLLRDEYYEIICAAADSLADATCAS